jgi:hypothetical protein
MQDTAAEQLILRHAYPDHDDGHALIVAGIGIAALDAAITYSAAKAKGVDGVLRSFAQTPFGPWLLVLVALGLIAFGLLSFFEAKWHRTLGGVPV